MDAVLEDIVTTQKKGGFKAFVRMGNVVCLMTVIDRNHTAMHTHVQWSLHLSALLIT
jgi:hypothetical protein